MVGAVAAEGLVLGAARALVAYEVRIGAAEPRGARGLVGVDHDVVARRLLDAVEVVVVHGLGVVVVAAGDDVADVAGLDGVVAVAVHQGVGVLEVALVVLGAGAGLVVHHEPDSLGAGVVVEALEVKVRVGRLEVEDVALPAVCPVLPAHVPSLDEHLLEAVAGGEVDVAAHLLVVGGVAPVGGGAAVVEGC